MSEKSENAFLKNLDKRNTIILMAVSLFRVPQTDATVPSVIQSQDSLKLHCVKIGAVHWEHVKQQYWANGFPVCPGGLFHYRQESGSSPAIHKPGSW